MYGSDTLPVSAELTGVVVEGPSEVTIEKEGEPHTYQFGSGLASGEIVSSSLAQENLSDVTPSYIQNTLIVNIDLLEQTIKESKREETVDEYSFQINLGIFKFGFKRTIP